MDVSCCLSSCIYVWLNFSLHLKRIPCSLLLSISAFVNFLRDGFDFLCTKAEDDDDVILLSYAFDAPVFGVFPPRVGSPEPKGLTQLVLGCAHHDPTPFVVVSSSILDMRKFLYSLRWARLITYARDLASNKWRSARISGRNPFLKALTNTSSDTSFNGTVKALNFSL